MREWIRLLPVLTLSLPLTLGCAPEDLSDTTVEEEVTRTDEAIINGTAATNYPEATLIEMFVNGQQVSSCSGAVIAPKVVLTAGHCVHGFNGFRVKTPFANNQTANASGATTFDWNNDSDFVDPNQHDIGLIFLATPINLTTYPTIATAPVAFGSLVRNIGRIRNGVLSNTKLYFGAQVAARNGAQVGFPFDYYSTEIIESGDSGGPVVKPGTHTIVAVNSGGGGGTQVLARVDLLATWIQQQVAAQGGGTTTTPPQGACGNVTFAGRCVGNKVEWCENNQLQTLNCTTSNRTCGFDSANNFFNCL